MIDNSLDNPTQWNPMHNTLHQLRDVLEGIPMKGTAPFWGEHGSAAASAFVSGTKEYASRWPALRTTAAGDLNRAVERKPLQSNSDDDRCIALKDDAAEDPDGISALLLRIGIGGRLSSDAVTAVGGSRRAMLPATWMDDVKAVISAAERACVAGIRASAAMRSASRLTALVHAVDVVRNTNAEDAAELHQRLAAATVQLYSAASPSVQQRCREAAYNLPTALESNLKQLPFSARSPAKPAPAIDTNALLIAIFNRLGGSSIASNVAGLARLALLAPHETMALIVLEAAQSPNLHETLHAALVQLRDFPLTRVSPDEPTLLIQSIRSALYPNPSEDEANGGNPIHLTGIQCQNLLSFVTMLLQPLKLKSRVMQKTEPTQTPLPGQNAAAAATAAATTSAAAAARSATAAAARAWNEREFDIRVVSEAELVLFCVLPYLSYDSEGGYGDDHDLVVPLLVLQACHHNNELDNDEGFVQLSTWLLRAAPLALLHTLCKLAGSSAGADNDFDRTVRPILNVQLEWVVASLAHLCANNRENEAFPVSSAWVSDLAKTLPWTTALYLRPLLRLNGIACCVPSELVSLCNLAASAAGEWAAADSPSTKEEQAAPKRRKQYTTFFQAARVSDTLACDLTAQLIKASGRAEHNSNTGNTDGDVLMPLHATTFIGCLTVTLASCTADQADRIVQHVVTPCIDALVVEAPPCFWFPKNPAAMELTEDDAARHQQMWDEHQMPHSMAVALKVWTRIVLSLNSFERLAAGSGDSAEAVALGRAARAYSQVLATLLEQVTCRESWGLKQLACLAQIMYHGCATAQLLSLPSSSAGNVEAAAQQQLVVMSISLLDKCLNPKKLTSSTSLVPPFLIMLLQAIQLLPAGDERSAGCTRLSKFGTAPMKTKQ